MSDDEDFQARLDRWLDSFHAARLAASQAEITALRAELADSTAQIIQAIKSFSR
jgi:hypothetical protein